LALFLVFSSVAAFARIGETALQFADRYGPTDDTAHAAIQNAFTRSGNIDSSAI
jgi:hypothetical protein